MRQVVRTARSQGVPSVLTDVLADPSEPVVARLRAFGRVAALLTSARSVGRVTQAA